MFVVMDAFALPVEGTETRVNAQAEAYEYMVDFAETNKVRSHAYWTAIPLCILLHCAFTIPVQHKACLHAPPQENPPSRMCML